MVESCDQLRAYVLAIGVGLGLVQANPRDRHRCCQERRRINEGDGAFADQREQSGTDEWRDQAAGLLESEVSAVESLAHLGGQHLRERLVTANLTRFAVVPGGQPVHIVTFADAVLVLVSIPVTCRKAVCPAAVMRQSSVDVCAGTY